MAYASASAIEQETDRPLRRTPTAIVERTGAMIGRAIASAVAVLDLRLVVLSGSVPAALGPPVVDAARRELEQRSKLTHLRAARIAAATGSTSGCPGWGRRRRWSARPAWPAGNWPIVRQ